MRVRFYQLLLSIALIHLGLMLMPIRNKIVIELPLQQIPLQVKLIQDPRDEEVTFVETEVDGVDEEVDTKFISERTQKVEKEQISSALPSQGSDQKKEPKKDLKLNDLRPNLAGDLGIKADPAAVAKRPETATSKSGVDNGSGTGSMYPTFSEEIDEGDKTSLNTIEFKYASFYKRMRDQVGNTWIPLVSNLSSSALAPGKYRTRIILKIDRNGEIIGMKLDEASGVDYLDEIAHQTFTKVRIFQNPPDDLFNGKDYLYIPWTLELRN